MNKLTQKREGFTIIEVVLVLAIVGLIMLMIFIAWPALQRGQRDSARKNDVNTVASAMGTYRGNTNGKNPTTTAQLQAYVDKLNQYDKSTDLVVRTAVGAAPTATQVVVTTTAKCDQSANANPGAITATGATSRQAAVQVQLEANGTAVTFCQDA